MNGSGETAAERQARLERAIRLERNDRVPFVGQIDTWAAGFAGVTVQEMINDFDRMAEAYERAYFHSGIPAWDGVFPPGGSMSRALLAQTMGDAQYVFPGWSIGPDSIPQHFDASPMRAEEYPELIADPYRFLVTKLLPRRYTELAEPFPRGGLALAKGALIYAQQTARLRDLYRRWHEKYGIPVITKGRALSPLDVIQDYLRGFRNTMLDIKQRPREVKAACRALLPLVLRIVEAGYRPPAGFPPVWVPVHTAAFLRPADFAEFFWPTFKEMIDTLVGRGHTCLVFFESNWDPYLELMKELPAGRILGLMENTDLAKAKEALGGRICLAGGFPTSILAHGTPDDVRAEAKRLLDTAAPGGGYVFGLDKTLLSLSDAKLENLRAVYEFVREYGRYE